METWRVYTHALPSVIRTEEVVELPDDAIPFRLLGLFRARGWYLSKVWDPGLDGNTIYFDHGDGSPAGEWRREG